MLQVQVQHRFASFALDASFVAPQGVTVLFGGSGSGKTTMINAVAGLLSPDAGRIIVGERTLLDTARGVDMRPHRRRIGYIFQEGRLFAHLSVQQNLAYGAWFAPKGARREDPARIIDLLGIGHLLARRPAALSGGEKQRVAIGRALLSAPELILADEPLAALDAPRKAEIMPYFERLRDQVQVPILYVTHAAAEVARLATHVVALEAGRVVAQGTAAQVLGDPAMRTADARQMGAVILARIVRHHPDGLTEVTAGGIALFLPQVAGAVGAAMRIRIAAQDVMIARARPTDLSALNIMPAVIADIRSGDGPSAILALDTAAGRVLARITQRSVAAMGLARGSAVHAVIKTVAIAPSDIGGPQ